MKLPPPPLLKQALLVLLRVVVALVATVVIVAGLTAAVKVPPVPALQALGGGAVGSPFAWSGTLLRATPILLTGLAVAWGFRCGLFNIGAEGQLLWGAIAAAWVGTLPGIPPPLQLPLALGAGALAGAGWAWPAALLKTRRGTPEVLTTLLLSFIAEYVTTYLANGPLHGAGQQGARTADLLRAAWLPPIETAGLRLHWGLPLAVAVAAAFAAWLHRSRRGFQIQLVGHNPEAARTAGISIPKVYTFVLLQSGALAGLAGAIQILGSLHYFQARFSPGYGYEGIPVAILGASHPLGVVLAALFWGGLANGAVEMESSVGVSRYLVVVIQALVVLAVAARRAPFSLRRDRRHLGASRPAEPAHNS